jgi:hypothetical protein
MDVPMNEVGRRIAVYEPPEAFEPPVTSIFRIVNMPWGRMGNHNVNPALVPNG